MIVVVDSEGHVSNASNCTLLVVPDDYWDAFQDKYLDYGHDPDTGLRPSEDPKVKTIPFPKEAQGG